MRNIKNSLYKLAKEGKDNLILHIPHSSNTIPFHDGYTCDKTALQTEILKLTDWYTDELFYSNIDSIIKADFSRIFCDVERFSDDDQEVMAKYGMGDVYERNDDGEIIRIVSNKLKTKIPR